MLFLDVNWLDPKIGRVKRLLFVLVWSLGCADGSTDQSTTQIPRGFRDGPTPMFWDAPPDGPASDAEIDLGDEPDAGAIAPDAGDGLDAGGTDDLARLDGSSVVEPDAAAQDAAELDGAAPDGSEPDVAADVVEPDAADPDAAEPDAAEPDAAEQDAAEPDAAEPDAAQPDAAEPDAAEPDAAIPDAAPDLPLLVDLGSPDPGIVVINEVDYDQPGEDDGEFIELANIGGAAVSLDGWQIELINGANDQLYLTVELEGLLARGELLLLAPPAVADQAPPGTRTVAFAGPIQNGAPDGLRLIDSDGIMVDGLAYEGALPGIGEGATPMDSDGGDGSLTRCAGAPDTDDNLTDFVLRPPTPGAPDACE